MAKEILNKSIEYIRMNKGKAFGGMLGFIIAILVLTIGFFKTFFIVLCTWIGYYLGKKSDNKEDIRELLEKIIPSGKGD